MLVGFPEKEGVGQANKFERAAQTASAPCFHLSSALPPSFLPPAFFLPLFSFPLTSLPLFLPCFLPCFPLFPHSKEVGMAAQKARLMREVALLKKSPPPGVQCWVADEAKMHMLLADVAGPPDSPYERGVFRVELDCSGRYPFEPPKARFVTPIYHPNIDTAGRICLDLLKMPPKGSWKPSINISTLLTSLQLLMSEPNPEDGLLPDVVRMSIDCCACFFFLFRLYARHKAHNSSPFPFFCLACLLGDCGRAVFRV